MIESFLGAFSALFSVANPLGAIPVFLMLSEDATHAERKQQALKIAFFMILILVSFFFAGNLILSFFGIEIDHVRIAGGILICISAMNLLGKDAYKGKPMAKEVQEEGRHKEDITFTPMAMPLLSGPGSIALMISMYGPTSKTGFIGIIGILLAVVLVAGVTALILIFSARLNKFLGKGGMAALSRMMGFITLSIGISMILSGLVAVFR
ncbi:MAG: MarC family protein [Cytophagales bacterium]|nr:MarC family protein [Cytophagales bacterium]